ncbi:S8 family peptidase [Bradyrhizobium yuanmingense]|uniref:S8 family peptidase n=1 Tax=Bradyrhizobium yuanmingense TaxID=108015 RepID=UPI0023B8E52F|nr:S8 family peptidase [Bradyrhizobium yuanmingense]MDF0584746.1 S8 family peptidase [Bradyrhizobium yuanmingense]
MADKPLLNPVLTLQIEPSPETSTGGGKGQRSIVTGRLAEQQRVLAAAGRSLLASRAQLPAFQGKTHLFAKMFIDSLAPTHAPDDLFHPVNGCQLVAPLPQGYMIEADVDALPDLIAAIQRPRNYPIQADISRVKELGPFTQSERLRERNPEELWDAAVEENDGKLFVLWLVPFRNRSAQNAVLTRLTEMVEAGVVQPTFVLPQAIGTALETGTRAVSPARQSSIARAMRSYRAGGFARATIRVSSLEKLNQLVASGASYRIDPVRPIRVAAPGVGREPDVPFDLTNAPIVGVVDGGLSASSYAAAEAWRASPLVPDTHADRVHGNGVSSLVVHAHAWNNNRILPELHCRVGTVQAVPRQTSNHRVNEADLVDHLAQVIAAHPETKVWNISANQDGPGFNPDDVSFLGHEISGLARAANVLPVISIGNVGPHNRSRPNAPADCEAALAVGGRTATAQGQPGEECAVCLPGPGPDGMMKPDLSWFSELRMLGGGTAKGSSYATPLVSSLAAHTFENLRNPTPDLVKALLINSAELSEHHPKLGWGTPYNGHSPWECAPGSVTLAWRAQLMPGAAYYWNDIPIPPEMIHKGKLRGRGKLTAVLKPLVSPLGGANYFASRLETALQYTNGAGDTASLLGSMQESTLKEMEAREELAKWQPIRRHCNQFKSLGFQGEHFRLYARVYTRDIYQFGWSHPSEAGPQEVAFVLSLWGDGDNDSMHDSTVRALGNFVESAVVNQEIEVER